MTARWGVKFGDSHGGLNLPLDIVKLVRRECPKLRHLSLNLGSLGYEDAVQHTIKDRRGNERRYGFRNELQVPLFDVRGFHHLITLNIFGIYGNLKIQARNLGTVLADNPQLRELSLSIQPSAIPQSGDDVWKLDEPGADHKMFCTWLCDEFSDRRKQAPLSLRRIYLGEPIAINATDFARLTQGQTLEQLFQYTGPIDNGDEIWVWAMLDPDLMVFSHETCPNLYEISVSDRGALNKLEQLLGSWPKTEVNGVQVEQWDQVQLPKAESRLTYRRSRALPSLFDETYVWGTSIGALRTDR